LSQNLLLGFFDL